MFDYYHLGQDHGVQLKQWFHSMAISNIIIPDISISDFENIDQGHDVQYSP